MTLISQRNNQFKGMLIIFSGAQTKNLNNFDYFSIITNSNFPFGNFCPIFIFKLKSSEAAIYYSNYDATKTYVWAFEHFAVNFRWWNSIQLKTKMIYGLIQKGSTCRHTLVSLMSSILDSLNYPLQMTASEIWRFKIL